ncbi:melanocyte proliferating gene 1, putative [Eimeria acervulina]|uniref:Melanocyte proliferating gene 1, putative n=1 Tax=Eimeria acervulina TaxID=5801 RepID=U6GGV4_EIMAC|nr:melanocyte proliferating gene 1, putative [Eimeria acervulina]CDI79481.1 melanocyte proliferating gene 1, putative [Eimeria acervulina]
MGGQKNATAATGATAPAASSAVAAAVAAAAAAGPVRLSPDEFWGLEGPVIGTHDGRFHLDEVLACTLLLSLKEFKGARICRSRQQKDWDRCSIVVDVGGEYCPKKRRFDHHQPSFTHTFDFSRFEVNRDRDRDGDRDRDRSPQECGVRSHDDQDRSQQDCGVLPQHKRSRSQGRQPVTKLSSAGLIFSHYGEQILRERYDAVDNGVSISADPLYVDPTTLAKKVKNLYPSQDEEEEADKLGACGYWRWLQQRAQQQYKETPEGAAAFAAAAAAKGKGWAPACSFVDIPIIGGSAEALCAFRLALAYADETFRDAVIYLRDKWLPARNIVKQAILNSPAPKEFQEHVLELAKWAPYEDHVYNLERELGLSEKLKFAVYKAERIEKEGLKVSWSIRCIQEEGQQFKCRLRLREEWGGLRDEALGKAVLANSSSSSSSSSSSGGDAAAADEPIRPEDFVFCHSTGFLGITKTRVRYN